jgi:site-specific recombinase XerD
MNHVLGQPKNTRFAYARAVGQFLDWCDQRRFTLDLIEPVVVAAYVEQHPGSRPTVKQHLAAIRMLFDWLVTGQVIPMNPAASVRGPKHVVKKGKTPVLTAAPSRTPRPSPPTSHRGRRSSTTEPGTKSPWTRSSGF